MLFVGSGFVITTGQKYLQAALLHAVLNIPCNVQDTALSVYAVPSPLFPQAWIVTIAMVLHTTHAASPVAAVTCSTHTRTPTAQCMCGPVAVARPPCIVSHCHTVVAF